MSTATKQSVRPQPSKPQSQAPQSQPAKPQSSPPMPERRAEQGNGREDEIRALAYRKWQEAGGPTGDGVEFWLTAEMEILRRKPR